MDRRDVRIPTNRSVRLKFSDRSRFETMYMRDISKGGLFVKTPSPREPGSPVTIILDLPGATEITLEGEVAHVVRAGPGVDPKRVGMGVALKELTPALRAAIEIYLKGVEDDFIDAEDVAFDLPAPAPPIGVVADVLEPPEPWELELLTADVLLAPDDEPAPARAGPSAPPAAPPPVPAKALPASAEELAAVRAALDLVEPRMVPRPNRAPTAYEVLGVKPPDGLIQIEAVKSRDRRALDPDLWAGRLPPDVHGRVERAARALDAAWDVVSNPELRAGLDLQLTIVPPPPSRSEAERRELVRAADRLHAKFAETSSDRVRTASTMADGAAADIKAGKPARARNALRLAISYDPLSTRLWALFDEADRADQGFGGGRR